MKERIKAWLKAYNHDRAWLGEQVGVSKKAVDNWLSSPKEIPLGKIKLIDRLIQEDEAAERERLQKLQPTAQVYSLQVDYPMFRLISRAALAHQQTIEDWSVEQIERAARQWEQQQIHQALETELASSPEEAAALIPLLDDDLKPRASSVTQTEAVTPVPAADSSNTSVFPQLPIAAEGAAPYQVKPRKRSS